MINKLLIFFISFSILPFAKADRSKKLDRKVRRLSPTLDVSKNAKYSAYQEVNSKGASKKSSRRTPASIAQAEHIQFAPGLNVPLENPEKEEFLASIDGIIFANEMFSSSLKFRQYRLTKADLFSLKKYLDQKKVVYITVKGYEDLKAVLWQKEEDENFLYYFEELYNRDHSYQRFVNSLRSLLSKKLELESEVRNFNDFAVEQWRPHREETSHTVIPVRSENQSQNAVSPAPKETL